ncbi:MAG: TRAP transporter small permease [Synergistaceae bacterium]|nr:TRAP transporter small permease [Synergistaceae bacterium]
MSVTRHQALELVTRVKRITEKLIDNLSVALLSGIFILGLCQVFWRWILRDPIIWSEELIQLTYVWICYLGWTLAERSDSHIRITAVLNVLPWKVQKYLQAFCHLLSIVFSILMVVYGVRLVRVGMKRTAVSLSLNYGLVYVMGPLCNLIIIFYEAARLAECLIKGPRNYSDKGGDEK